MKTILMSIIIILLSFEVSAGILMEALSPEWQYAISVASVFFSFLLCRTPLKVMKDKLMTIIFTGNIGFMVINILNIALIQNWGDKLIFINLSFSFISLSYYYIYHYILPKTEKV